MPRGADYASVITSEYAETYYFRNNAPSASLAATLGHATDLARSALTSRRPEVRRAATILTFALEDLADLLDERSSTPPCAPTLRRPGR